MTWTVACFCGQLFTAPPMRCRRCGARTPDVTVRPRPLGRHTAARLDVAG